MDDEPQINAVRQLENGDLERYNGETWVPYLDIEQDLGEWPLGLARGDDRP
ncbi:hypothetical protein [Streptomyces sediminimaris]|uniref:hypothetical protein n=1 Tax=Streptomyces sediminimaris TaxID=3383721 RepID=UPI00399997EF